MTVPNPKCEMCGLCCELFLINLNESEYLSRDYQTMFSDIEFIDDYVLASDCGANLLARQSNGRCIYLVHNKCGIHELRPSVCRDFFCHDQNPRYSQMRAEITREKVKRG